MASQLYKPEDSITCYVCHEVGKEALYIAGMSHPYDWVCLDCIKKALIASKSSDPVECSECDDTADRHFCEYHYDRNIAYEREDAQSEVTTSCYDCGYTGDYMYCESCAEERYGNRECDDCTRRATIQLCEDHGDNIICTSYPCSERVSISNIKCDKHKTTTTEPSVAFSDDGSTITTDGITVKWEV